MGTVVSSVLCRDCAHLGVPAKRCAQCGGPRFISHPELTDLTIAHLDCDAFFASVEKRDNPTLRDKPLAVGGTGRGGVVMAACYLARIHGVRSAMPMFKALKLCPNLTVIPASRGKYSQASRQVRALMEELTPLVEPISIDEAYLDLSGTERLHGHSPAQSLVLLQRKIEREVGVTASVGLSHNKFLAKLASDRDKPRGFAVIGRAETLGLLASMPVSALPGVGKALARSLEREGLTQIRHLRSWSETDLMKRFGLMGRTLHHLAHGRDVRPVKSGREAKSVSSETTFDQDIGDFEALDAILWRQCERLSVSLKTKDLAGKTLHLKLKTAQFRILTRSSALDSPTQLASRLYQTAVALLRKECSTGQRYRLLGVGVSHLSSGAQADQPDLMEPERGRQAAAERAVDCLRAKFGPDIVGKGRGLSG